jgi:mono/diheme cytochrome c family protein
MSCRQLLASLLLATTQLASAAPTHNIRQLLSDKCFQCHGPDANHRKANLRLDTSDGLLADLGGYQAVTPGHPDTSELIRRIKTSEPADLMPPAESGKSLSAEEITQLENWILAGAQWSGHWAYTTPTLHPIPAPQKTSHPANWIDAFILQRLEQNHLQPSPPADPITLLRRLTFDLTGLPPSPDQIQSFTQIISPADYDAFVDSLLENPAFGERMAAYWLDLVRYADTVGYHGDQDHNISPYRDWIIHAFNNNMPFDQFTREQLAGDLLPNSSTSQKIASGYNRLLQTTHEGGLQPREYIAIYAADRVRNLSTVWMGATVGCAQCHDHKYDPYTLRDFYSLAAFFADIDDTSHFSDGTNDLPTKRAPEIMVFPPDTEARLSQLRQQLANQLLHTPPTQLDQLQKNLTEAATELEQLRQQGRLTMVTQALSTPRTTRILPRGNWLDESGEIVQPAIPQFLGTIPHKNERATRLDLANWLTNPSSPQALLTARIVVNRFWYLLFGQGLSPSLDDFGNQGSPPSHPELLDNLAIEFVQSGWNTKAILKLITSSQTYRQSSTPSPQLEEIDPANILLARQSRWRLPAEMIRDTALSISGLLVHQIGGPSIKPYQPAGYYQHLNFPTRTYSHHTDSRQWRRGLYVHWQRQFLHPMLKAFDAPSREECTAQRPHSNTPLASLTLLNDPTFVEAARALAAITLEHAGPSTQQRIKYAFHLATSRQPDPTELQILTQLHETQTTAFNHSPTNATQLLQTGISPIPDHWPAPELAAWTQTARAILNLNETYTRN